MVYNLCRHGYQTGATLPEQLATTWLQFKRYCKRHKISYPKNKLTAKVIGLDVKSPNSTYPEMNSRTKASHVKPLIHFLAHRWKQVLAPKFRRPSYQHAEMRSWCALGLSDFLHTLDCSGIF